MEWYSLFVVTGKEGYVQKSIKHYFSELDIRSIVPKRKLIERKGGVLRQTLKTMFPGYVFIFTDMNYDIYYRLKRVGNIVKVLNYGDYYTRINDYEMEPILKLLGNDEIIDFSKVFLAGSKIVVNSGPLKGMEGMISRIDKRKSRAKIALDFLGKTRVIDVGIEVLEVTD